MQIGDLKKSLDFYEQDFGMHVHRHEVGLRNVLQGRWDGDDYGFHLTVHGTQEWVLRR